MAHRKPATGEPCGPPGHVWGRPSPGATRALTEPAPRRSETSRALPRVALLSFFLGKDASDDAPATRHTWLHPPRASSSPGPRSGSPFRVKKRHQTSEPTKVGSPLDFSKQRHSTEQKNTPNSHFFLGGTVAKLAPGTVETPGPRKLPGGAPTCWEPSVITCPV